eukprot:TRINITY_DN9979_c0_g1_i1.p1 TRINITY_DN9979_c0_g1~~TRINITY_DN9979_c0_g1_i1.p1  ORF type:complete len:147 (-),score=15.66 TRINITY_DN9979_c0_g1_i1:60-440(-)
MCIRDSYITMHNRMIQTMKERHQTTIQESGESIKYSDVPPSRREALTTNKSAVTWMPRPLNLTADALRHMEAPNIIIAKRGTGNSDPKMEQLSTLCLYSIRQQFYLGMEYVSAENQLCLGLSLIHI